MDQSTSMYVKMAVRSARTSSSVEVTDSGAYIWARIVGWVANEHAYPILKCMCEESCVDMCLTIHTDAVAMVCASGTFCFQHVWNPHICTCADTQTAHRCHIRPPLACECP